jgi:chromosomal replication initiation ATPase DnaA
LKRLLPSAASTARLATPLFVDEGNRACVTAIHRVAAGARDLAGPLVLVGPPDSGKTRLIEELQKLVFERGGTVLGGTVREWTARLREAIESRGVADLTASAGACDLLVIDEFHRLSGAPATREYLCHRIAERIESERATVVAARHAPQDIRGIAPRAASLLLGGFVLFTSRAGPSIRRRYLASISGGKLTKDAIERLCAATPGGLGALRTAWLAWDRPGRAPRAGSVAFDRIAAAVARKFDVDPLELVGRRKLASLARAREALLWTASRLGLGAAELAGALDGRRRSGIERALARARMRAAADPNFREQVEGLAARLAAEAVRPQGSPPRNATQGGGEAP